MKTVSQRVWIFVSAAINSSIVVEAAGAVGTDEPIAKVAITATTADFIRFDLITDFPRIQIMEVEIDPISNRQLMPIGGGESIKTSVKRQIFKALSKRDIG
jgi:hypothetical protein